MRNYPHDDFSHGRAAAGLPTGAPATRLLPWPMLVDGTLGFDPTGVVAQAIEAEAAGYDGIWSAETSHDPFLPLVLAAEHTERLQVGTGIAVAFARNPMTLASTCQRPADPWRRVGSCWVSESRSNPTSRSGSRSSAAQLARTDPNNPLDLDVGPSIAKLVNTAQQSIQPLANAASHWAPISTSVC